MIPASWCSLDNRRQTHQQRIYRIAGPALHGARITAQALRPDHAVQGRPITHGKCTLFVPSGTRQISQGELRVFYFIDESPQTRLLPV